MTKVIGTCMVSNEADIIEAFARHNLGLLDALVVLDHASIDATCSILQSLVREGLPIVLLQDPDLAFRQGGRQTELAKRYLAELDADFCFALDADEFIRADDRETLHAALARVPPDACALVEMQNYIGMTGGPSAEDNPNPAKRFTRRLDREEKPTRKVVLARSFAEEPTSQVSLGNHAAIRAANGQFQPYTHVSLSPVKLAHFPVRSAEQIAKKALIGWLAHRLTKPERFAGAQSGDKAVPASHWRDLFNALAGGHHVNGALLEQAADMYLGGRRVEEIPEHEWINDPIPCAYELRYSQTAPTALASLAVWADRLVSAVNASSAR